MPDSETDGEVTILMGVYNGAKDLAEQLASFAAQSHGDWRLVASDDGSTDDSGAILRAFAEEQVKHGRTVEVRRGPARGFAANFLTLIGAAPEDADWLALSDQDDVWLPDRLARGIAVLRQVPPETPALYCSRTWITDARLQAPRLSMAIGKPPGFRNALVQNIAAGNTILLNRAAAGLARQAAPGAAEIPGLPAHDWWLYQLVTGTGGAVIHDPEPTLYYRQHDTNQIGANDSWRARAWRIRMLLSGRFTAWNSANLAALAAVDRLTPENRAVLETFRQLRTQPLLRRLRAFGRIGLYRQTGLGQAALWLAVVLRRL